MNGRERLLIILLAAVAILMGGYKLLIERELSALTQTTAELVLAQSRLIQMQAQLDQAKTIDADSLALAADIVQISKEFFPPLENDKIHLFFDGLALRAGVSYSSFSMTGPVASAVALPPALSSEITYPAKEAAQQILSGKAAETDDTTGKAEEKTAGILEMMTVSIQFDGTYAQGLALLDEIRDSGRTLRISSVGMVAGEGGEQEEGLLSITITAECYGVLKTTPDELAQDRLPAPGGKADPFQ